MAKYALPKATTNATINVFVQDSSSTTGGGLTGLVFNTASLTCYYVRPGSAAAALTLATQTVTGAHSDGGFVEIDSTNMPGWYRLDLSDAILATGVDHVGVHLRGATNMAELPLEIQLTDVDLNDAVRGGMTALPNAAADAAGGLPISDAGGLDLDALDTQIDAIETDTQDVQSRLPAALVSGKMDSDMTAISGDTTAADRLEGLMDGVFIVQVNGVATTTSIPIDGFTSTRDDQFNGRLITILDAAGEQTDITDYDHATQTLTVTALTAGPADDVFIVIH